MTDGDYTLGQIQKALEQTEGDADEALEWLLEHADDMSVEKGEQPAKIRISSDFERSKFEAMFKDQSRVDIKQLKYQDIVGDIDQAVFKYCVKDVVLAK